MSAMCVACRRELEVGESAWADDWTVIDAEGVRLETRYTCDGCADGDDPCCSLYRSSYLSDHEYGCPARIKHEGRAS